MSRPQGAEHPVLGKKSCWTLQVSGIDIHVRRPSTRDEVRLSLQPILHFGMSNVISNPVALYATRLEGTVAISYT